MSVRHPAEREGDGHGWFDEVAERASNLTSSPAFFGFCVVLILAWILSYPLGAGSDTTHILGSAISAVTLFLLALLKNSEQRAEQAIQEKLDAIAAAMLELRHGDEEEAAEELARAIGLHDEV